MINFGKVKPGDTLCIPFSSFAANSGASITLTGLAVTDIEIYKDGGTTQRGSDNGYTLLDTDGIDFDGVTGIHAFSINLADNSTAGFYAAGSDYFVVVSTVTVDNQTVSFLAAKFTIGYVGSVLDTTIATLASQTSFTLTAGPAEDDALNGMWLVVHDVASAVQLSTVCVLDYTGSTKTVTLAAAPTFTIATTDNISVMGMVPLQPTVIGRTLDVATTGEAGVDWANVGSQSTSVNLSGTTVATASAVTTVNGLAAGTITAAAIATGAIDADAIADNAIDVGAIADGAITAAKIADGAIDAATFAAGAITATVIATDAIDADALADNAITTATFAAGAINSTVAPNLDAAISSRSTVTTGQVNTEVLDVLTVDTFAEPAGVVAGTATIKDMINWLKTLGRNKVTQTATTQTLRNDADSGDIATAAVSDDTVTFTRAEWS